MKRYHLILSAIVMVLALTSCEKFLSERNSSTFSNIYSLHDMQALMDAGNKVYIASHSGLLEMATDNFFLGQAGYNLATDYMKAMYLWRKEPVYTLEADNSDWMNPYHIIAIMNTILDEVPLVKAYGGLDPDHIKGTALFHRAFAYHNLAQIYCKSYDPLTAQDDLGLPIRSSSDINAPSQRASLAETLSFIEADMEEALTLLPVFTAIKSRPDKASAHGFLARFYLYMGKYKEALEHANLSLSLNSFLMDFNKMDASRPFPIDPLNKEILFYAYTTNAMLSPTRECYIDTTLYDSYTDTDLRREIFFKSENNGYHSFRGAYTGTATATCFIGPTVSEVVLIKSEAQARLGLSDEALLTLNEFLKYRYREFEPFIYSDDFELLSLILDERRKELVFRGSRWSDLKRLNKDTRFETTLFRKIPGTHEVISLSPNDPRYVFLIPESIIEKSGLEQNPR